MAKKDLTAKQLESIPEVFADIFNGLEFYDKEQLRIDPSRLKDLPTESIYYDDDGNIRNMLQDEFKGYGNQLFSLVCLGLENQASLDRFLAIRILGYIYAGYKNQLENYVFKKKILRECMKKAENDRKRAMYREELDQLGSFSLTPTIILVLNFSGKTWNEPKSLEELVDADNPYREYMCNFSIKVIDMHLLQDEDYERFTSDFGPVASFLNAKDKDFFGIYRELKYPLEALSMIHAYKHLDNYEDIRNDIYMRTKKREAVNMGTLIDIVRAEGMEKGKAEGKAEGKVEALYYDANFSIEQIAEKLSMSQEEIKDIISLIDR